MRESSSGSDDTPTDAWALLLEARRQVLLRYDGPAWQTVPAISLIANERHAHVVAPEDHPRALLRGDAAGGWSAGSALALSNRTLVELYLPMLAAGPGRRVVVGHLGQSLDARIATVSGHAFHVTGEANLVHLHRCRALSDAVIVGGGTVATDDPRLTTRLVPGDDPVRVVIDRRARSAPGAGVFSDGAAPSLLVCAEGANAHDIDAARVLRAPEVDGELAVAAILDGLARRGLHALFVEGGGVTVSRWMRAGALDRLQVAVAPLLVGDGRPALQLPGVPTMDRALRPPCRVYRMGEDVLWDFDLRARRDEAPAGHGSSNTAGGGSAEVLERLF